ncbi:hypothetical protein AAEY27_15480 [Kosakonia sp. BYX6]|uniref:Conjugal transfer protein TraD n=1 Tax=Kosakonia calanthes TaxID=3139408 RepID=A0ABZ3B1K7_9ENTR
MNYQTTALWIYAPLYILIAVAGIGLSFFGLSAPIFYVICIGLIFPVIISMRLHTLSESGQATLMKETSNWTVYVQGIPVQEKRSSLKNPCFFTPQRTQQFFMRGFIARLCLQLVAVGMLIQQTLANPLLSYYGLAAVFALLFLLVPLYRTLMALREIYVGKWALQYVDATVGYQAFFIDKKGPGTALNKLLSVL